MTQLLRRISLVSLPAFALACGSDTEEMTGPGQTDGGDREVADAGGGTDPADARPSPADSAPPPDGPGVTEKIVFATSTTHSGALGGLGGADSICGDRADEAELPGTFKAWLSSGETTAAGRLSQSSVPYVRTDGVKVADDWSDLVDGSIDAPINRDEDGNQVDLDVWTGTLTDGSAADVHCDGFTDGTFGSSGLCGDSGESGSAWTDNITPFCSTPLRLYCLQQ